MIEQTRRLLQLCRPDDPLNHFTRRAEGNTTSSIIIPGE